ncbi:beta-ketoacyl synthase N-terminal-like domain-containing protein, partial [Chloroflexota bacterium]
MHENIPRIVITGMGAITPLGTVSALWSNLKLGISGIRKIQSIDTDHLDVKIAGEVEIELTDYVPYKVARRMARASLLAMIAARMAKEDAGLDDSYLEQITRRVGVVLGTAQGGYETAGEALLQFRNKATRPSPFALISALPN